MSMWCTNSSKVVTALLWLVAGTGSFAADISSTEQQLSISDPRPVAKALEILSQRHGIVITYEDPPYAAESDLKDVTTAVSRSPLKPGQSVLVPRGGVLELTYSVSAPTGKLDNSDAVIRKILDAHLVTGAGSQFELIQQGDVFHVVPVMVKNSAGAWVATRSILDAPITLPVQPRSGTQIVDAICNALSTSKVRVAVGMVPEAPLASGRVVEGGTNEPARDILSRSLKQLSTEAGKRLGAGDQRQYVWQLLFDPSSKMYFLNLSLLPQAEVMTQSPKQEQSDPAAPDPNTSRPR
jgi:hypothetical protein